MGIAITRWSGNTTQAIELTEDDQRRWRVLRGAIVVSVAPGLVGLPVTAAMWILSPERWSLWFAGFFGLVLLAIWGPVLVAGAAVLLLVASVRQVWERRMLCELWVLVIAAAAGCGLAQGSISHLARVATAAGRVVSPGL